MQSVIAFDNKSASRISLNNGTVMMLREISDVLAMVYIVREENEARINKGKSENASYDHHLSFLPMVARPPELFCLVQPDFVLFLPKVWWHMTSPSSGKASMMLLRFEASSKPKRRRRRLNGNSNGKARPID
jgi:hypothetical protein